MSPRSATPGSPARSAPLEVVALFGPTGVGKTAVVLALADVLRAGGENPLAVSADALQVYAGLEVLTGAPSVEERQRLEHRLLGVVPIDRTFSVGEFMPLAHREIDEALEAGRRPIVVGGTGLYLRGALADLDLRPPPFAGVRERLAADARERGVPALHADLQRRAPRVAERLEPEDRTRVIRALELLDAGEEPQDRDRDQLWTAATRRPTLLAALTMDRNELYARIDRRVEEMVAAGAREEVQRAEAAGASATARKALGYEELRRGDVEAMKASTRHLAKRQMTWLRKLSGARVIDVTGREPEAVAAEIAAGLAYSARPPMAASSLTDRPA